MRGDLHNQFVIDTECNRHRGEAELFDFSDYPAEGDTVRGERPLCGVRRGNQFEPFTGKGDVARATLYFLLRYPDEVSARELPPERVEMLLRWHREDPVSMFERHRNASIYVLQGNRNPFVDHPEWATRDTFAVGGRAP
jgi:endonuclease I